MRMEMKWLPDATGAGVDKEVWSQWAGPHPSAEVGGGSPKSAFLHINIKESRGVWVGKMLALPSWEPECNP